jgi:hypothetical protein
MGIVIAIVICTVVFIGWLAFLAKMPTMIKNSWHKDWNDTDD